MPPLSAFPLSAPPFTPHLSPPPLWTRALQIKFPAFFSSLLKWIGLIQLDLFTLMPLECLFPTNFHTTLLLRTIIPLIVMLVLGLAGLVTLHMAGKTTNVSTKALREPRAPLTPEPAL